MCAAGAGSPSRRLSSTAATAAAESPFAIGRPASTFGDAAAAAAAATTGTLAGRHFATAAASGSAYGRAYGCADGCADGCAYGCANGLTIRRADGRTVCNAAACVDSRANCVAAAVHAARSRPLWYEQRRRLLRRPVRRAAAGE